jgi:glycosyltransferase involved in cell wall biosynthesis
MDLLAGQGTRATLVPVRDIEALARAIAQADRLPRPDPAQRQYAARFTVESAAGAYVAAMRRAIVSARQIRMLTGVPTHR